MKNNKLIIYKDNIFTRIFNFFKNLFSKNNVLSSENESDIKKTINDNENKVAFFEEIQIKENEEEVRLKQLKLQYDNGEIDEDDMSNEDIDKLIQIYEKETNELNADTERIKNHIAYMLKELKYS